MAAILKFLKFRLVSYQILGKVTKFQRVSSKALRVIVKKPEGSLKNPLDRTNKFNKVDGGYFSRFYQSLIKGCTSQYALIEKGKSDLFS